MRVQAEISLYPLRTEELSEPIETFCRSLADNDLSVELGPMSTRISGELRNVFRAVRRAFEKATRHHQVVLDLKLSNACPDEREAKRK